MQIHVEGKFECKICNIKFTRLSLNFHQRRFHGASVVEQKCQTCKARFASREGLGNWNWILSKWFCQINGERNISVRHEEVHRSGNVKCELCKIRFTPNSLVWHQKHMHPGMRKPVAGGVSRCKICKISFTSCRLGMLDHHGNRLKFIKSEILL